MTKHNIFAYVIWTNCLFTLAYGSILDILCGRNKRLVSCPENLCVPLSCSEAGYPVPCPIVGPGGPCYKLPQCICIDGYLKNSNGVCVPKEECRNTCGINERLVKCPETLCIPLSCEQVGLPVPCPIVGPGGPCYKLPVCICVDGYLRNSSGVCVPKQQCQKPKANEVWSSCGEFGCEKRNCTQIDQPDLCIDPIKCVGSYVCAKGYLRARNGTCIPKDQCHADIQNNNQPEQCSDDVLSLLQKGNAKYSAKFLYEAHKADPNTSLIMSPCSTLIPIAELALFAEGDTYNQLMETLNLRNKNDIRCVFPTLTNDLKSDEDVILKMAAKIYSTDKFPLAQKFLDDTKNIFDAEAENMDFLDGNDAADKINGWVANNTNNRIKDIVSPDMFDENTRLVLANAVFFLGNWVNQFNPNNTVNRPFYLPNNKSIEIPTMYQQNNFKYGESADLDSQILEIPYKDESYSFFILLPNNIDDGLPMLMQKLLDPNAFYNAYGSTTYEKVNVFLPKIEVESQFNLADIMKKAGMVDIFDYRKSNLTGILQNYEPMYIDTAIQKSFMQLSETGTEAAAANVFIGASITSIGIIRPVYTFNADRPFLFFILKGLTIIFNGLFMGK